MITPSQEFCRTHLQARPEPLKGLDAVMDNWLGLHRRRPSRTLSLAAEADRIEALAPRYEALTDAVLRRHLEECRTLHRQGSPPAAEGVRHSLAAIRELAFRTLGMRPFRSQIICALALHQGCLAEMATGEGKTLAAAMTAILRGWTRKPCHVITVNDYLAGRDAAWMAPLYRGCLLSVGHVTGALAQEERVRAYANDVTYCTGKEIVADFLRDRLRLGRYQDGARRQILLLMQPRLRQMPGVVMRGIHSAIVDEADSILIDEAVTPVIIAIPKPNLPLREASQAAFRLAGELAAGEDFRVDPRHREIELLPAGRARLSTRAEEFPAWWRGEDRLRELVTQALVARELFHAGLHYVVRDGKVHIVDDATGRIMHQRTWRAGLHQAIEAKEGVEITDPTETVARLSFQRFFRFFTHLSGMTGTAWEAASEFWRVYGLPVLVIPTNAPSRRRDLPDRIFPRAEDKWRSIAEEVRARHATRQPVLVGTRGITHSEELGRRLIEQGVPCRVLNALNDRDEAAIIAGAGAPGCVTIATNMAGRGTDIRLGHGAAETGGLHVIASERHESSRVDRQLYGRSGRQGDPGSAQAFVSLEDDLLRRYVPEAVLRRCSAWLCQDSLGGPSAGRCLVDFAQSRARRQAFQQRINVLATDTWIEEGLSFAGAEYS